MGLCTLASPAKQDQVLNVRNEPHSHDSNSFEVNTRWTRVLESAVQRKSLSEVGDVSGPSPDFNHRPTAMFQAGSEASRKEPKYNHSQSWNSCVHLNSSVWVMTGGRAPNQTNSMRQRPQQKKVFRDVFIKQQQTWP